VHFQAVATQFGGNPVAGALLGKRQFGVGVDITAERGEFGQEG
jgi:hypothetical protein